MTTNRRQKRITRRSLVPLPTEHQEQVNLFRWASLQETKYPELVLMYATPNQSYGSTRADMLRGKRFKAEGRKPGVPDILLPVPRGKHHGLYIEMKREKGGSVSPDQKWWAEKLREQGYVVYVARGWQMAMEAIVGYLNNKPVV